MGKESEGARREQAEQADTGRRSRSEEVKAASKKQSGAKRRAVRIEVAVEKSSGGGAANERRCWAAAEPGTMAPTARRARMVSVATARPGEEGQQRRYSRISVESASGLRWGAIADQSSVPHQPRAASTKAEAPGTGGQVQRGRSMMA